MTDLSILCLHNSTTSWESQQRGGIVEDVMEGGGVGGAVVVMGVGGVWGLMDGLRRWDRYEGRGLRWGEEKAREVEASRIIKKRKPWLYK